jgi:hypothetical protein
MPLKFPVHEWRFATADDLPIIPSETVDEFLILINKVGGGDRWDTLETFKESFRKAVGSAYSSIRSSSESWAETDLEAAMKDAAHNAPMFLEAFFDACETLKETGCEVPGFRVINTLCVKNKIPFRLDPPNLIDLRIASSHSIPATSTPPSLAETAHELLQKSLNRSEELLAENRPREAVQELLWLLESISTTFKGDDAAEKYFNTIVRQLKKAHPGTHLSKIIEWTTILHGYLSSPTGGGIRHGMDLDKGRPLTQNDARLFCNLIRSYLFYLVGEHERLNLSETKS